MAIPKVLYQTYISYNALPLVTRFFMRRSLRLCPKYRYEFYDDSRIEDFLLSEYGSGVHKTYKKISIGAAKADFFRYAILYKKGGIYLDVDSLITKNLDGLIKSDDFAIISRERNPGLYVQWALIYAPGHPFLEAVLEKVIMNIETNRFPHDVHSMTGPRAYSDAINECLQRKTEEISYREFGVDYEGFFQFKYRGARFLYRRRPHWQILQQQNGILSNP